MSAVTKKQRKEIKALARMKESEIDVRDVHELADWSRAVVGKFYRPMKKSVTIRLDADVLAWLKCRGKGYQTRLNGLLRQAMQKQPRR